MEVWRAESPWSPGAAERHRQGDRGAARGEGAASWSTDVNDEGCKTVACELGARGWQPPTCTWSRVRAEWQRAMRVSSSSSGGWDVLVNNAGVRGEPEPVEETSLASWDLSSAVLQTGVFLGMKWAAPALLGPRRARVVKHQLRLRGQRRLRHVPAYHAAKGAVRSLTKTAGAHLGQGGGVRVNSVHPGFIDTTLLHPGSCAIGQGPASFTRRCWTSPRWDGLAAPEEVAAGVAYLASDDAAFCHRLGALHLTAVTWRADASAASVHIENVQPNGGVVPSGRAATPG